MSLIKANAVQIGLSPTATQNFTLEVPSSPNGTIKLARGNSGATTQDVMTVSNTGVVSFPQGFNGAITGTITANVIGNLTGNVTGDVIGDVTGDVTGNLSGNVTGNTTGNLTGDVYASNGTSKVLENGTNGTDATFTGSVSGGTLSGNASPATALAIGSSTARSLANRFADVVNVLDFGADPTGAVDSTDEIQAAINFATLQGKSVFIPSGDYFVSEKQTGIGSYAVSIFVPANNKIFGTGRIFCNNGNIPILVIFAIKGSNVEINGITFDNTFVNTGTTSSRSVGIGAGNRNFLNDESVVSNISILNCNFYNQFYSIHIATDQNLPNIVQNIKCSGNNCKANDIAIFSGAINFRDDSSSGNIKNITISNNKCYGATNAAGINLYGVDGFAITGNISSDMDYSGIQCENGCSNGTICSNYIDRASRGIWIDDSRDIVIDGNTVICEQRIPPEGISPYRDSILITRQGFTGDTTYLTTGIIVSNNICLDGRVRSATFGSSPIGEFGDFVIFGNLVKFRDSNNQQANGIVLIPCQSIQITGNTVIGGTSDSISLNIQANQFVTISDNITKKAGIESSYGLYIFGDNTGYVVRVGNLFQQGIRGSVGTRIRGLEYLGTDGSRLQFQNINIEAGFGSPEGNITSGPGSLYMDKTDFSAKLYIKIGGFGNTNWTQLT